MFKKSFLKYPLLLILSILTPWSQNVCSTEKKEEKKKIELQKIEDEKELLKKEEKKKLEEELKKEEIIVKEENKEKKENIETISGLTYDDLRKLAKKIFVKDYGTKEWKSKLCQHEGKALEIWKKLPLWTKMDDNQRETARKNIKKELGSLLATKQQTDLLQKKELVTFTDNVDVEKIGLKAIDAENAIISVVTNKKDQSKKAIQIIWDTGDTIGELHTKEKKEPLKLTKVWMVLDISKILEKGNEKKNYLEGTLGEFNSFCPTEKEN
jgi:hypothetical protein